MARTSEELEHAHARRYRILQGLISNGWISRKSFMEEFQVSGQSFENDMVELRQLFPQIEKQQSGKAVTYQWNPASRSWPDSDFSRKLQRNPEGKLKMARWVASQIDTNSVCCFGAGTTAYYAASEVTRERIPALKAVAYSLPTVLLLALSGISFYNLGGRLTWYNLSFLTLPETTYEDRLRPDRGVTFFQNQLKAAVGELRGITPRTSSDTYSDVAIIGAKAFDFSRFAIGGKRNSPADVSDLELRVAMLSCSEKWYILYDSDKFIARSSGIDYISLKDHLQGKEIWVVTDNKILRTHLHNLERALQPLEDQVDIHVQKCS